MIHIENVKMFVNYQLTNVGSSISSYDEQHFPVTVELQNSLVTIPV